MIVLEVDDDGVNVDWAVSIIPIPLGLIFSTSGTFVGNTGIPTAFRNSCTGPPSGVSLGHLIVTTGRDVGWLAPADTAFVGEPATNRVQRLCDEHGIPVLVDGPTGGVNIPSWGDTIAAGVQAMGPQQPAALTELLAECAEVDIGFLGEQRHRNGILYRSGATLRNQSPRVTLDFSAGHVPTLAPENDDQRRRNDVTATRPDGGSYRVVDPDVEAGSKVRYDEAVEVNVARDAELGSQAGWRFHQGTWPGMRYPSVDVDLAFNQAALADDWLAATEGDMVRVTDLPDEHPPGDVDLILEGSGERWSQRSWKPTLQCSPAGPWEVGVLGDDDLGKLDTAGSALDAAFDAGTDTTMDVETTLGPLWTTDAGEFPFDVDVGGARVTVTAIGAAVGQVQTFTVSTTVANGIAKTIPAGTPVSLWRPARLSL
jgi:hypothetical protein